MPDFVAVIGAPNAGKSTLVNALVGSKVSIVTPKVQTTRMQIRGVAIRGDAQIVFVDTPGIFKPRRKLDRAMVKSAWAGAGDADAVLVIVDAPALASDPKGLAAIDTQSIVEGLRANSKCKAALVLNKVDALPRAELLPLAERLNAEGVFERVFMISALKGDGLDEVAAWCVEKMPAGHWLYPEDQAADIPMRLLASEITREKLYMRLHEELPYATAVETELWTERKDGSVKIDQVIYVQREGQKAIVLGKGGRAIKAIGEGSRRELEEDTGPARPSVPVRKAARELGRDARTLRRHRPRIPGRVNRVHGMERRGHRAVGASPWRNLSHPGDADAHARPAHGDRAGRRVHVAASRPCNPAIHCSRIGGRGCPSISAISRSSRCGRARATCSTAVRRWPVSMPLRAWRGAVLPEREPHENIYHAAEILLDAIAAEDFSHWAPLYVRWEAGLLEALGFGLDLSRCAATGSLDDLIYVSPKSGRAVFGRRRCGVSRRLFALPPFLLGSQNATPTRADIAAGLRLTEYFLLDRVLAPHFDREMPAARFAVG